MLIKQNSLKLHTQKYKWQSFCLVQCSMKRICQFVLNELIALIEQIKLIQQIELI